MDIACMYYNEIVCKNSQCKCYYTFSQPCSNENCNTQMIG